MSSKFSMMKRMVVTAALVAGVSGIAHADNSMNRFGGDGYAYFHEDKPIVSHAPLSPERSLSESELQALSSSSESPWPDRTTLNALASAKAPSSVRQPLSEKELQALSSESPVWQYPVQSQSSAFASTNGNVVANTSVK